MFKSKVTKYTIFLLSVTIMVSCGHSKSGGGSTLSILSTKPVDGETNVSQTPGIVINFSQSVTDVNTDTIQVYEHDPNGPVIATTIPLGTNSNKTFALSPQNQLTANMTYYVRISSMITAINNSSLHITTTTFSFTTGQFASPTVDVVNFEGSNTGFPLNPDFQLLFSVPVTGVTASSIVLTDASGASVELTENGAPTDDYQEYSFMPTNRLAPNTTYILTVEDTITDLSVNHNHCILSEFTFTTGDYTIPTVQWYLPLNTSDMSLNPTIVLQYSKLVNNINDIEIKTTSCTGDNCNIWTGNDFLCGPAAGNTFTCAYTINNLSPSSSYDLIIPQSTIEDDLGDFVTPTTFIFTTGARPTATVHIVPDWADTTQPPFIKLAFSEPVTDVTNVYYSVQLIDNTANNGGGAVVQNITITGGPQNFTVSTRPMTSTSYSISLGQAIVSYDDAGIPMLPAMYFENGFNPADYESPQVISTQVIGGAQGYTNPPAIQIIFNVNVSGVFTGVTVHGNSSTGPLIGASITGSGRTYTITTSNTSSSTYYLVAGPAVTTAVGRVPMTTAGYTYSFNPIDWESPTVTMISPCYYFPGPPYQEAWWEFQFSQSVTNINSGDIILNWGGYNAVYSLTTDSSNNTLTIAQNGQNTNQFCGYNGINCLFILGTQIVHIAPNGETIPIVQYGASLGYPECTTIP